MDTNMTEGKPLSLIIRFMIPLWIGNIFQQLYNMCDTIIVGRYVGDGALAAVGSTGTVVFMVLGLCNGMATGFTVLTPQNGSRARKGMIGYKDLYDHFKFGKTGAGELFSADYASALNPQDREMLMQARIIHTNNLIQEGRVKEACGMKTFP